VALKASDGTMSIPAAHQNKTAFFMMATVKRPTLSER
jgi:hypothetical protein